MGNTYFKITELSLARLSVQIRIFKDFLGRTRTGDKGFGFSQLLVESALMIRGWLRGM
jgi:hypothetical protein